MWINQSITRYKVLNLLLGPLPLKISFNFRKHAFGSYFFCYEIIRVKRDRGEAAIEFICFNKWNEAKPRNERSFNRSCINPNRIYYKLQQQLIDRRRLITINRSPSIQESTPYLPEHALWTLNCYVFGVIVNFKTVEKTQLLTRLSPNLCVDSILHFLLLMLQYLDELYSISWYLLGMLYWYVE